MPDSTSDRLPSAGSAATALTAASPLLAGLRQPLLVLPGIVETIAEDVGLAVVDLDPRHVVEQLEQRAVVVRIGAGFLQLADDPRRAGCRIERLAGLVGAVGDAAQQRDVERQRRALGEQDHGAARPHRVADAEFVEHVGIGAGDVGDGVVAQHQPLEHRLVDGAADPLLVGADRFEPHRLHRRRDDVAVDGVEIGGAPGRIGLAAERHQHKAQRGFRN